LSKLTNTCCKSENLNEFLQDVPSADDVIKRIQSHKGVQGVIVTAADGI